MINEHRAVPYRQKITIRHASVPRQPATGRFSAAGTAPPNSARQRTMAVRHGSASWQCVRAAGRAGHAAGSCWGQAGRGALHQGKEQASSMPTNSDARQTRSAACIALRTGLPRGSARAAMSRRIGGKGRQTRAERRGVGEKCALFHVEHYLIRIDTGLTVKSPGRWPGLRGTRLRRSVRRRCPGPGSAR